MDSLDFNNLVVLRTYGTDDGIVDFIGENRFEEER